MFTFIKKLFTKQATSKILCPFHHELTPSMTINHTTNKCKCFGCGYSGTKDDLLKHTVGVL